MGLIFRGVEELSITRDKFKRGLHSENTIRSYAFDWALFRDWCAKIGKTSLPADPETVSLYVAYVIEHEEKKISTAARRTCAIAHYHREQGLANPVTIEVKSVINGARRLFGEKPRQMRPLTVANLRAMAGPMMLAGTATAARDRAILVVGLASGLRGANLVLLNLEDVEFCAQGAILSIGREKQDQSGRGRMIGLPRGAHVETCPIRALEDWLTHRGPAQHGPLFTRLDPGHRGERLNRERVRKILKTSMQRVGLDSTLYGAHSLRAGLVTEAAENGVDALAICGQTGHRSVAMVRRYFRRIDAFRNNAAAQIGL